MLSKKHITLLLLALSSCHLSYAQHKESADYDNAKKVYYTLYDVDDAHIAKGIKSADSLIDAGTASGNWRVTCLGYNLRAWMACRQDKIEDALAYTTKWKELEYQNKDYKDYFRACFIYCNYQQRISPAKALLSGQKIIEEAKQIKYMPGLVWGHYILGGLALYYLDDYSIASQHFEYAIKVANRIPKDNCPDIIYLHTLLSSSLSEEHKFAESEKEIEFIKKTYKLNGAQELNILNIQLDNAYYTKKDVATYNQIYQKIISNKLLETFWEDNEFLIYKIRWLIRNNRIQEALAEIPQLESDKERYSLKFDAYETIGDWHKASIMKDSIQIAKDDMRSQVNQELIQLKNNELSIESTENKTRLNVTILLSISAFTIIAIGFVVYIFYRRRRQKLENERKLFIRNITHQLRTPMTVVTGMVEQLKDHIPADDTVGLENIEATRRQSRKLQELIIQLARMSKTQVAPLLNENGDIYAFSSPTHNNKEKRETPTLPSDTDKPSILLAEDTDDVAMMMVRLLQDNGYAVTRAVDGKEALDILQRELPDLLITDIAMPRMNGLQLMRNIRMDNTMCHLPIIVASARVEDSERMEGISAGAEVYLTKPFIPEELLLRVSTLLEQRKRLCRYFSHTDIEEDTKQEEEAEDPQMSTEEQTFITNINKCIDDNMMSGDININFIAESMFSSVSTVSRKLKNITGMPTATYIRMRRMLKAKTLLRTTDKPINEIEIICGYNSSSYFAHIFKLDTGMSPSEYRLQK